MRVLFLSIVILLSALQITAAQDFFQRTDKFLSTYVDKGKVNYSAIVETPAPLKELVTDIEHTGLAGRSDEFKIAFYINSYNILTIYNVVTNWPVNNPLKVPGFFDKTKFNVSGEQLTLNEIEHDKLIGKYGEERVHFALVCAGQGCPELTKSVINPASLDIQLDDLARLAMQQKNTFSIDSGNGVVYLSKIFEWYMDDFAPTKPQLLLYLSKYTAEPIPENYGIEFIEYDWTLNGF